MRPSEPLFDYLKGWEGLSRTAYWDSMGRVWTCGYGHTGGDVAGDTTCTLEQAAEWLRSDVQGAVNAIDANVHVVISQCQYDALVAITYNVGPGSANRDGIMHLRSGGTSTLMRCLNAANYTAAALQFTAWDHGGGVVVEGLHKRRVADQRMFLYADYSGRP